MNGLSFDFMTISKIKDILRLKSWIGKDGLSTFVLAHLYKKKSPDWPSSVEAIANEVWPRSLMNDLMLCLSNNAVAEFNAKIKSFLKQPAASLLIGPFKGIFNDPSGALDLF
jgi:hypothetical protein